ncbi:MAG: hypothetical protein WCJ02_00325 [bacterium]
MTITKHKKTQARASKMATKKPVQKKLASAKATSPKKSVKKTGAVRKIAAPLQKKTPAAVSRSHVQKKAPLPVVRSIQAVVRKDVIPLATKPSALTCPLVLDGIVLAVDFLPRDCFSCDEFDCRFYSAEERSGPLGSRLFAGEEDGEEDLEDAELFGFERGEGDSDQWGDEDEK